MVKSWLLAELGPPQLLCAPLPGTKLTLEQRLKESCFEPKWFGCIGKRYGRGSSIYKFDPRTAWFDDLVRCAGGAEDLHEALRECAPFAGRVRELLCLAASRGEALELGLATWNRLQTDGNTADSLAMMLAAYLACFNHIDLLRDDVSALPYFVQILAEFVRFGLFKQDKETVELRYGEKLERFTAMAGRGNPTAADLLAFFQGLAFSMAVPALRINKAKCRYGVQGAQHLLRHLACPWVQAKYGTATPAEALAALRAFDEYYVQRDIIDTNSLHIMGLGQVLGQVRDGTRRHIVVQLINPVTAVAEEALYVFERKDILAIWAAKKNPVRLAALSRKPAARRLVAAATFLAAGFRAENGLRVGEEQPRRVPSYSNLYSLFSGELVVDSDGNVSHDGTIFCSIGYRFLALDGEILVHKGVVPAPNDTNLAMARDTRHKHAVEVNGDDVYAAKLREDDAKRDALWAAPPAQTKEEAIAMGEGHIALVARCSARGLKQSGTVAQLRARLEDPQPEDYPHCAPRAPHAPQGPRVVDPAELQRAEAAPLAEAAGASRSVSALVLTPPSLDSIATRPKPVFDAVVNFAPPADGRAQKHCLMCGKQGVEPLQANETAADCVVFPTQQKGVCRGCGKAWWVSNGCYFKWCQGRKSFQEIHEFEGRLTASKCNAAAKENREKRRKRDAAKAPGPAKKARKA